MNKKYIIGIDIGTTNIKGSLYSQNGEHISSHNISYKSYCPQEGYYEQDSDDWVKTIIKILEELIVTHDIKSGLYAISLSTQGGTLIPVDKDYDPLTRAITWLDRRGASLFNANRKLQDKNIEFYEKTGWRLDSNISFLSLYWLRENRPSVFNKIHKVMFVNDYILKKITGNNYHDPSNASITQFYNILDRRWDSDILNLMGFSEDKLSPVKDSGEVIGDLRKDICQKLDIDNEVKVINGGHDQYCAGIGAGIFNEEEILLSTGTAWVIFKMIPKPLFDTKRFFAIGRNITKDKYGIIYSIPSAGASIKWFARDLMNLDSEEIFYRILDKDRDSIAGIKNSIIFHPYLTGAHGPDFDLDRKASFENIKIGHNYLDFVKAIMEGAGFQLKKIFNVFEEKEMKIRKIKMVGGGSKSTLWPQIIADITGTDVLIPVSQKEDFAAKGAAIIAGYGAGIFKTFQDGFNKIKSQYKVITPDPVSVDYYRDKYKLF